MVYSLNPLFALLFFSSAIHSQTLSFQQLLDSGKIEFKRQVPRHNPDYSKAYSILNQAVSLQPNNTEARYFFGYALDRKNGNDASAMHIYNKDSVKKASEQFEFINNRETIYRDEIVLLDPYTKITSLWASLAFAYLNANKTDSAIWALREGKKRGGFIEPVLEYNRQVLRTCNGNSILLTDGDILTFPVLYLQYIENLRPDITAIDVSMIHTGWYPKFLKNSKSLQLSYTDTEIDTLDYRKWEATEITIANPSDSTQVLKWILKPTYQKDYILKGDLILLDILKQNVFKKDIYFSIVTDSTSNLFLENFLIKDGLLSKLVSKDDSFETLFAPSKHLSGYTIEKLEMGEINKSPDAVQLLQNYRWAYLHAVLKLVKAGKKEKANELYREAEKKFDETKLPFTREDFKDYFKSITR